jgi:hypothetical protein
MLDKNRNPEPAPPPGSLEDWLQLPDSPASDEDGEQSPARPDDTESVAADAEHNAVRPETLSLFPEVEHRRAPDAAETWLSDSETEPELEGDTDEAGDDAEGDDVTRLGGILSTEFGDTLTGANALALPIGVLFLILAVVGWFLDPLLSFLGAGPLVIRMQAVPLIAAAVLGLGGLHLVFYWAVHRVSNAVKSGEMDRLIELRRVKKPCTHLDCRERAGDEAPNPSEGVAETKTSQGDLPLVEENIGLDEADSPERDFAWRCSLFEVDLEDLPLCAVCDRYEPRTDPSGIIVS